MTSHVTSHCEIGYDRSLGVENCPVCCVKGGALLIMNIKTLHRVEFLSDFVHCIVLSYLEICSLSLCSTAKLVVLVQNDVQHMKGLYFKVFLGSCKVLWCSIGWEHIGPERKKNIFKLE